MTEAQRALRRSELASAARQAEQRGERWTAGELWRRYELVLDGGRNPDDLLGEGIVLSHVALELAAHAERGDH